MRPLLVVLLVGCTEQDLALQQLVAEDVPMDAVRERTELRWIGDARLTPDGPPIDPDHTRTEAWAGSRLPVVEIGDRLRVISDGHYARLLLWLDPGDLGTWVIEDARGGARPGRLDGETGVFIDGGTEVDVVERDGDWVAVELQTRTLDITTWMADFDVGPYWVDREREHPYVRPDVWLTGHAELLDSPRGDLLATVRSWSDDEPDVAYAPATELDRVDGHALVEVTDDDVSVLGWVSEDQVHTHINHGWGSTGGSSRCGGAFGWGVSPALHLPAGTPLFSGPDGEWVGETVQDKGWPFGEPVDGWTPITVQTLWGTATVWVW